MHRLNALCHFGGRGAACVEFLQALLRISSDTCVGDLYADLRRVFDGRVEGVEGQDVHAAELASLVPCAEGDSGDRRGKCLRFGFKSHGNTS